MTVLLPLASSIRSPGPLSRYVGAASLVRSADGGAGLALVLVAMDPATGLAHPATTGGLLVAALSAPHVAGPVLARRLDGPADGRRVLAVAFVTYAAALAAAALLLGRAATWLVAALVVLAGLCGPLLTGGLSSRLAGVAGGGATRLRRAEGWDAVTYGVGGTAGAAVVASLAAATSPVGALLALAGAAVAAGALTLTLPAADADDAVPRPLTVRAALAAITRTGPLRRVTYTTMATACAAGGLSLLAVALGARLTDRPSAGAALVAAFGAGNLLGSLALTRWPVRGEPERLTVRHASLVGVTLGLCAAAPTYVAAVALFALAGVANAPFFTATLAARGEYAPRGARAQVFVWVAGLKVAALSVGTALTGVLLDLGPRVLLLCAGAFVVAVAGVARVDLRVTRAPSG